jgi:hypothetical protein
MNWNQTRLDGRRGIEAGEVEVQAAAGQLGELPGHLDAGGAADHEGEPRRPRLVIVRELGHLESAEYARPHVQGVPDGLQARRVRRELIVTEVTLAPAGGDDQAVVRRYRHGPLRRRRHRAGGDVDRGDLADQHAQVALPAEDLAGGRGHVALGQDAGRHLVEQRLEQVVGVPVDQGDADTRLTQRLGGKQPAEAGTNHDDAVHWLIPFDVYRGCPRKAEQGLRFSG